jgi:hypothetical protein
MIIQEELFASFQTHEAGSIDEVPIVKVAVDLIWTVEHMCSDGAAESRVENATEGSTVDDMMSQQSVKFARLRFFCRQTTLFVAP